MKNSIKKPKYLKHYIRKCIWNILFQSLNYIKVNLHTTVEPLKLYTSITRTPLNSKSLVQNLYNQLTLVNLVQNIVVQPL